MMLRGSAALLSRRSDLHSETADKAVRAVVEDSLKGLGKSEIDGKIHKRPGVLCDVLATYEELIFTMEKAGWSGNNWDELATYRYTMDYRDFERKNGKVDYCRMIG